MTDLREHFDPAFLGLVANRGYRLEAWLREYPANPTAPVLVQVQTADRAYAVVASVSEHDFREHGEEIVRGLMDRCGSRPAQRRADRTTD